MKFLEEKINFMHLSLFERLFTCFFLSTFYVSSLYLWSNHRFKRNEPGVLKRRFISVFISSFFSICFIYLISQENDSSNGQNSYTLAQWIGFKFDINALYSFLVGIFLTLILFIGPIVQDIANNYLDFISFNENNEDEDDFDTNLNTFKYFVKYSLIELKHHCNRKKLTNNLKNLLFWRNYVISPLTEELVFRSCMLTLVFPVFSSNDLICIMPLFFGIAHLHHILEGN